MTLLTSLCTALALLPAGPDPTGPGAFDRARDPVARALAVLGACSDVGDARCIAAATDLRLAGDAGLAAASDEVASLSTAGQLLVVTLYSDDPRPEATDLLLPLAKVKKSAPEVRALALDGLAKRRDDRVLPVVRGALADRAPLVRHAAVRVLSSLVSARDRAVVAALAKAARDPSPEVRAEATYGLGFCGCDAAGPVLRAALGDHDLDVRRAAAEGLSFVKDARAVPHLVPLLRSDDELLRRAVGRALRFQTDESLGDDEEAWQRWLDSGPR